MAAIYEFHVAGRVGSVVKSALPELETFELRSGRTLHGTADERREIDRLLELIQMLNLSLQRLHIATRSTGLCGNVPVVDDRGAQHDVL